jgi:hypothetical protein
MSAFADSDRQPPLGTPPLWGQTRQFRNAEISIDDALAFLCSKREDQQVVA